MQPQAQPGGATPASSDEQRLLQELQTHQIELKAQNDELLHARAESQAALERYAALYDFTPVGYFTFDRAGTIRQLNPAGAALLGAERDRLLGRSFLPFVDAKDRSVFSAFLDRLLGNHQPGRCEFALDGHKSQGPRRFIRLEAMAEAASGQLSAVAVDLTEKKRIIEELERSNLDLQQFAFIAAHDLQTPLRSITGFAQLLDRDYRGRFDADADEWLSYLVASAKRMHALIQDLLAYSRVDSRGGIFQLVDLGALADNVVATLEVPIREAGGGVTRDELPTVMGDRTQLAQALQNLVDNGIKYRSSAPPRIHVAAWREGDEWVFAVSDNGIGIGERHRERIFDLFHRLHTERAYPGTGIGLAICRRVIHRHGGRIWVSSRPGEGSTFYFSLPIREPATDCS